MKLIARVLTSVCSIKAQVVEEAQMMSSIIVLCTDLSASKPHLTLNSSKSPVKLKQLNGLSFIKQVLQHIPQQNSQKLTIKVRKKGFTECQIFKSMIAQLEED